MGLLNGSLYVRVSITCLVVWVPFMMASYEQCIVMQVIWYLLCELLVRKVWPPTPTVRYHNTLASVGTYSL
jgi:hypothetical protein